MKNLLLLILLIFVKSIIISQENIDFTKSNFQTNIQGYKTAIKHIQTGDVHLHNSDYKKALEEYLIANEFNPNNSRLNAKIGDCYLHLKNKAIAAEFLNKAYSLDSNIDSDYIFLLGKANHLMNKFDLAIKYYRLSLENINEKYPKRSASIEKKIDECLFAKEFIKNKSNIEIVHLSNAINSEHEEYVPVITADESLIFFTARRPSTLGGELDPGISDYFEDIYYSRKVNGNWTEAINIEKPVNSTFHDATVGVSLDGQKLFLYRDNKKGIGNIYVSNHIGNKWSAPLPLPEPINSKHQETSACFSPDGNTIYFVSNRPGGHGKKDIYKVTKNANGNWGEAHNLGSNINTEYDEDAIFLHPDGKTIYFSSKGHNTIGGYDIFKSYFENDLWSVPQNIGYPINTTDDDIGFVLSASGEHGYYTSSQSNSIGKRDLYQVKFIDEINKPKLTLLKGIVSDKKDGTPIGVKIEIFNNDKNELIGIFESNSVTGAYMVSLPSGVNYGINIRKTGYLFYSENINIPKESAFEEIENNVRLDKIEKGEKIVLKNIFYEYDQSDLTPSSHNELNKVIELLRNNPNVRIELSAHTDSRGTESYNKKLSQERAQSCVNYIISHDIKPSRLVAKGYGETNPIITEQQIEKLASEEEKEIAHQKNRRTELNILTIENNSNNQ